MTGDPAVPPNVPPAAPPAAPPDGASNGAPDRPPAARPSRRRASLRAGGRLLGGAARRWLVFAAAVGVWEAVTRAADDPHFPPPTTIARTMHTMWFSGPASRLLLTDTAVRNVLPSLGRMLLALAIGVVFGIAVGLALGRSERVYAYLDPILQFARTIPPPTLVPVFIVLLNVGTQMQLASILFSVIWPMLLNTADGARTVDPLQMETARVFRLSPARRLATVIFPSSLPKIFAGLRLSLSLGLILMVFSELMPGTSNGIGFQLVDAQSRSDLPTMWSAIVLLGILGYVLNVSALTVERRVLGWHRAARRTDV